MRSLKSRRARDDLQDYRNQAYIAHLFDERVFDIQNSDDDGDGYFMFVNGAPDAPDYMPAGSMKSIGGGYYDRSICERGVSLAQQQEMDAFMLTPDDEVEALVERESRPEFACRSA